MEFFRKYQRPILFTAVLFALVTFSVTGPIMAWAESLMAPSVPKPTLQVNGRTVEVTDEDRDVALELVRRQGRFDPTTVLPPLFDRRSENQQQDVLAALRRLAIEYGVDVSDDEVEKAIARGVRVMQKLPERAEIQDGRDLAVALGYASYGAYRNVVREALRISNFVRVQALAAYPSDAALVEQLLEERKLVTFRVLAVDAEKIEEQVEAELGEVDDATLLAWLEDLEPGARARFSGPNRVQVKAAYIDVEAFDPEAFGTELDGFTVAESDVDSFYELQKSRLFTVPKPAAGDGEKGDGEKVDGEKGDAEKDDAQDADEAPQFLELDEALRARITRRLKAAQVIRKLWPKVEERYTAQMADALAAVDAARRPLTEARAEQFAAEGALAEARIARDEARAWADKPDATQEQKDALAAAEAALEAAQTAVDTAREAADARVAELQEQVDAAVEAAEAQVDDARAAFDLAAVWTELAAGRAGFGVAVSGEQPVEVNDLREFPGLGKWEGNFTVNALTEADPFSNDVQHVADKAFGTMLARFVDRPIKPIEDVRDEGRSEYFAAKAKERAEELGKKVEETLEAKARERVADKIAELEAKRDADLTKRLDDWRTEKQTALQAAKDKLADLEARRPGMRVTRDAAEFVASLEAELATEEAKRESILATLQAEVDTEVEKLIRGEYPAVLAEVAAAHELEITTVGPYPRDLSDRPRPRTTWPKTVQFLFWDGSARELAAGEATEFLTDPATGSRYVAVAESVEPATLADVSRRDLMTARERQLPTRFVEAVTQSFSIEGLKQRHGYHEPREITEPAVPPAN